MRRLASILLPLAFLLTPSTVHAEGLGAQTCTEMVEVARSWVSTPEKYMESPRLSQWTTSYDPTSWFEVDHYESEYSRATDSWGYTPVYKRMTVFATVGHLNRKVPTDDPRDAEVRKALDALLGSLVDATGGDFHRPLTHDAAMRVYDEAGKRCG